MKKIDIWSLIMIISHNQTPLWKLSESFPINQSFFETFCLLFSLIKKTQKTTMLLPLLFFLSLSSLCSSFKPYIHRDISQEALSQLGYSQQAIDTVSSSNAWTDLWFLLSAQHHCDDESFSECSNLVLQYKDIVIQQVIRDICKDFCVIHRMQRS